MKFPEASEEEKRNGWEFSPLFLHRVHQVLRGFPEALFYISFEIQQVLLAAQQVMEEQKAEPFQGLDMVLEKKETGNPLWFGWYKGLTELSDNQVDLDPEFSKTVDRMLDEMIQDNPFGLSK